LIEIRDLVVDFDTSDGPLRAVDGLSVDIGDNEFVSLIGPSGCGKTTILRSVAALVSPTAGEVRVGGKSPVVARNRREIGVVFQVPVLFQWRTALENVQLPLEIASVPAEERRRQAQEALDLVDLGEFGNHAPDQLSGGMKQRVSIARALVMKPSVLLMDEPFGALDAITRDRLNLELMSIRDRIGGTTLFVTHSIREAVFLSDRVVVLSPRPARVLDVLDVPYPRPRSLSVRDEPSFNALCSQGLNLLEGGWSTLPGEPREEEPP